MQRLQRGPAPAMFMAASETDATSGCSWWTSGLGHGLKNVTVRGLPRDSGPAPPGGRLEDSGRDLHVVAVVGHGAGDEVMRLVGGHLKAPQLCPVEGDRAGKGMSLVAVEQ
jgi:hypothetical protein